MNWGMEVLQTSALPLGYVATYGRVEPGVWVCFLARVEGFEPSNDGIRIRCLTAWLYPNVREMGWAMGFEPTHAGATTLCLDHLTTPTTNNVYKWSGRRDSNPRPSPWQGDALPLSHFRILAGPLPAGFGWDSRTRTCA